MRYLTPAKIALITLIGVYKDGAVPNETSVAVLSFITSHIVELEIDSGSSGSVGRWSRAQSIISIVNSLSEFERLLLPSSAAVGLPGRRLWDYFLKKLWAINSLDALHDFFDRISLLLEKTREELKVIAESGHPLPADTVQLSRNSPFGSFVRRSQLEFRRLQFSDATELWQDFVKYRQPTYNVWSRRNPATGPLSFDAVLENSEQEWGQDIRTIASITYGDVIHGNSQRISSDDLEQLLEFNIEQLQKMGQSVPSQLRAKFSVLLQGASEESALSDYLRCLEAWKSGDYTTAFDCLHRYFDYTMHNKDKSFYQYALLNLAILQADFGCNKDAIDVMLETVSTARENRDMICLNFATSWIYNFGTRYPDLVRNLKSDNMLGTGREALALIRAKAKETGMWSLWSSALLHEALSTLSGGGSISTAMEYLVRSSQVIVEYNVSTMLGTQTSLGTALWDRTGLACLSGMTSENFLRCHSISSSFDDVLKITCRLSGQLATAGKYNQALSLLEAIDPESLKPWKVSEYWHNYRALIKIRRDLHRNNLDSADHMLSQILQSNLNDVDPDMDFVANTLHIEALRRRGNLKEAFAKNEEMISSARTNDKDLALRVRLLLIKATLFQAAGRPQRGFSIAMRAASIAWRARLMSLLRHSIGAVADVLNSMGDFDAAAQLTAVVIPRSLESESAYQTAILYSIFADAHVGLAGAATDPKSPKKRHEHLIKAKEAFDQAILHYRMVEEVDKQLEAIAKAATIMKFAGDMKVANDYAAKYLELRHISATSTA